MDWDAYFILKTIGIVVFIFGGSFFAHKRGFPLFKSILIAISAVALGFVFSRFWFILQHVFGKEPYEVANFAEAWDDAGSVLYGWILGGLLAIIFLTRKFKWDTLRFTDSVAPWMLVAQTLNRFGCFAGECCWGKPTAFFFSIYNSHENAMVHPVQLYEAAIDFVLFCLCCLGLKKKGHSTVIYFSGYALARFFLEFMRGDNQPAFLFFTVPQLTSLVVLAAVFYFWRSLKISS